jgi:predicted acetyltransferase
MMTVARRDRAMTTRRTVVTSAQPAVGDAGVSTGSPVEIRPLEPHERPEGRRVFGTAMLFLPPASVFTPDDPYGDDVFEQGRWFGAFDEGRLVGSAESFGGWLAVPGGARVPHAAVSLVGVLPTHTRRGLLTRLMRAQLEDVAARGEVAATLRASEAVIYERFGYGIASTVAQVEVARARARLRPTVPTGGPVRLLNAENSWDLQAAIYERMVHQPGAIGRPPGWWTRGRRALAAGGRTAHLVVHGEPGAEDGYACYEAVARGDWQVDGNRAIRVRDLVAGSAEAHAGLLRFLLDIDFVDTVVYDDAPLDDPLRAMLTDPRAVRTTEVYDETWLRLVDVPAALAARTYAGGAEVRIEVVDPLLPGNSGVYAVSAAGAARGSGGGADLTLGVADLGAVYLGGTRFWQLARAGRVVATDPAAIANADALFAVPAQPYAATGF